MNFESLYYLLFILNILLYIAIGIFIMLFTISSSDSNLYSTLSEISDDIGSWIAFIIGIFAWPIIVTIILALGCLAILIKSVSLLVERIKYKFNNNE